MADTKKPTQADRRHKSSKTVEPEQGKKKEKKEEQKPVLRQSHLHEMIVIKKPEQ
jgi:hypothetical protein